MKIYHNTRCKKSRAGLQYLRDKGIEPVIIEYLKDSLSVGDLKRILMKLNKKPDEIIRQQEAVYKSNFKNKKFTDNEWIKILIEYPKLIRRPIIETSTKAVIGDPVDEIDKLF